MLIGIIYLGRRGSGGKISLEIAGHMPAEVQVFAAVSVQAELLPAWESSGLKLLKVTTFSSTAGALRSLLNRRQVRRLAEEILQLQPDVLLFPMFHPWNPLLQTMLRRVPSVVIVHDPQPHPGWRDLVYSLLETQSIRKATRCILLSQSLQPALVQRGCPPERMDIIPQGLLSYRTSAGDADVPTPRNARTILYFGRIAPYKGLEVLLPAFRALLERMPDARLVIAGEGSLQPYRRWLKELPNLQIVNRWIPENEIPRFFQEASLVVLPYTSASQSGVITIAADFALPVVSTRVGGIVEQIKDGLTGRLVDPGSVDQLSVTLEEILLDFDSALLLGQNLARDYRERYNWESIGQAIYTACVKATLS